VGPSPARSCVRVFILIFFLGPLSEFALAQPKPGSASFMADAAAFRAVASPVRLERGRYLVESVAHCFGCHGQQDFKKKFGQPKPGTKGAGEVVKNEAFDGVPFPDGLVHPNITPDKETGAGTWIGHDGRELLDFMPYAFFRSMTDEDVASVIVYIRSLPAVRNALPKRNLPFPVKVNLHPEMEPPLPPDSSDQVKHGWYLVRIAQCNDCHTPNDEHGNPRTDMMFGGGARMKGAWGDVVTPNITPDPSGISHYDETMFIKTIRTGRASGGVRQLNPLMPYSYFRNMTDDDLKAIFAYLRTIKPVRHHVDNSEPPVYCKLCRQKHGFGDKD
jgi:mono/diheme cytochrome c family protein